MSISSVDSRYDPDEVIHIIRADEENIEDICEIHSHYVRNTRLAPSYSVVPPSEMVHRLRHIDARGLPFLIAVSEDVWKPCVLGYAHLTPYGGMALGYASTMELTIYVHPEYVGFGAGSLLLLALLEKLRSGDGVRHDACELRMGEGAVAFREDRVRNIIARVPLDPSEGVWVVGWLERFGFEQRGRLSRVGFKNGQWYDLVYLQYTIHPRGI